MSQVSYMNSQSDNELNLIDNEDDEGEDETCVEDREILGPMEKADEPSAAILLNARNVKEHFNNERRCPPCPLPGHFLTHFSNGS